VIQLLDRRQNGFVWIREDSWLLSLPPHTKKTFRVPENPKGLAPPRSPV